MWSATIRGSDGTRAVRIDGDEVMQLADTVVADLAAGSGDVEPLRLVDTTTDCTRSLGDTAVTGPTEVRGSAPDLLGWLTGRTDGAALRASTPSGAPPSPPPRF